MRDAVLAEKLQSVLVKLIGVGAFLLFTMVLLVNLGADFTEFTWKKNFLLPNIVLIAAAGVAWYAVVRVGRGSGSDSAENSAMDTAISKPSRVWPIALCTVLLFFLQLWICYSIFFETGWDPAAVAAEVRNIIENRGINWQWYFQAYPNNLTLAQGEYWILRVDHALNLFRGDYELMGVAAVNCGLSSMTCMLVYFLARRLFQGDARLPWMLWGLSVLLIGLSPWMVVAYTDSMGLIFPVLCLFLYLHLIHVKASWGKIFGWPFLLILGYCGYRIKPQAMIMLIAIGIAELLRNLRVHAVGKTEKRKKLFGVLVVLTIFGIAVMGIRIEQNDWRDSRGFVADNEKSMDPLHYLNMGLNTEQDGAFLQSDLDRSAKFDTRAERDRYNLQSARNRIRAMGPVGLLKHLARKMMVVYADGTFAWGCEPDFWQTKLPEPNGITARFLREFYYEDGVYYRLFETMEQALWIFILVGCWISSFQFMKDSSKRNVHHTAGPIPQEGDAALHNGLKAGEAACGGTYYHVMALAIMGITAFEILFEARARYLYLYAPVFVLLAGYGVKERHRRTCRRTSKK